MNRKILKYSEIDASFEIFEPAEKKFRLTPNWIVVIMWSTTLFFFWVFDSVFPPHSDFRSIWLCCVVLITLYFLVVSFFTYEALNGIFKGKIVFGNAKISVNNKVFGLTEISNLDFNFSDYHGQRSNRLYQSANPMLSQGVDNYVTFFDSSNEGHLIYFKMLTPQSYLSLSVFINQSIKLGKMEFKRGIDLLGIENVSIS